MKQSTISGGLQTMDYVDTPIRVRYADTDTMSVVYYGTYPVYFEAGRAEYMRAKGLAYRDFEAMGYHLVVVNLEAKYYNSAVYDDLLIVRTRLSDLKSRALTFHYEVYRDETLLVEGRTKHICVNGDKKTVVMPPLLLERLRNGGSQ